MKQIIKSLAVLLILLTHVLAGDNEPKGEPLTGKYLEKVLVVKAKPPFSVVGIPASGNSALELASMLANIPAGKGVEQRFCEVLGQPGYLTQVHYQGRNYTSVIYRMPDGSYNSVLGVENPAIKDDDLVIFDTKSDDIIDSLASIASAEGKTSEIKIGSEVEKPAWFKAQYEQAKFVLQELVSIRRTLEPGVSIRRLNYDPLGRIIRVLDRNTEGQVVRTTYTYNLAGQRLSRLIELLDSDGNVVDPKSHPTSPPTSK